MRSLVQVAFLASVLTLAAGCSAMTPDSDGERSVGADTSLSSPDDRSRPVESLGYEAAEDVADGVSEDVVEEAVERGRFDGPVEAGHEERGSGSADESPAKSVADAAPPAAAPVGGSEALVAPMTGGGGEDDKGRGGGGGGAASEAMALSMAGDRGGGGGGGSAGASAAGGGGGGAKDGGRESGGAPSGEMPRSMPAGGRALQQAYGVLTAGTFDDNANFDAFRNWAAKLLGDDSNGYAGPDPSSGVASPGYPGPDPSSGVAPLREHPLGERVEIHVINESGGPVRGAKVEVALGGSGERDLTPLLQTVTHGNGRVVFFSELDGERGVSDYVLAVTAPGSDEPHGYTVSTNDPVWEVKLPYDQPTQPRRLDLAFVVDATGSMMDELEYLKLEVGNIVEHVQSAFPDVDQRYALIVYRDHGDAYVTRVFDFTDSLEAFQTDLYAQQADGGGDYEEAVQAAYSDAASLNWHGADSETASVLFHIADAPPHGHDVNDTLDAARQLRLDGVTVFPVGASGVESIAEYLMRFTALVTQGQYIFLTDDSGVGNPHAEPHIPCYHVEHLDEAMSRLVASELAGGPISPRPDAIVRTIGNPVNGVCMPENPNGSPTPDGATPELTIDPRQQAP